MSDAVQMSRSGAVAIFQLNEAERRNALSPAIRAVLQTEIPVVLDDNSVRCMLITGTGRSFCAGGDIASLAEPMTRQQARDRMALSYDWIGRLLDSKVPVITAVNGPAVGAGLGLAMLGDIVLAARSAWFLAGFSMIGLAADYGLGRTLPRAVGAVRAKDILLNERRIDAAEAERIGMVARVFDDDALHDEALAMATRLAAGPTQAFGLTKQLVAGGFEGSVDQYLNREGDAQSLAFTTRDHRRGVAAFLAKDTPQFEGN